MATYIKNADIFGRIGSGIGQGISDSLPKEIERGRLAEGLKTLGQQQGLTPFQQFAALSSLPGATPQMIQSGSELLRNQSYLDALQKQYSEQNAPKKDKGYIPTQQDLTTPLKGELPTLADPESTEQSYKEFIPPTEQEERQDAFENFQKNPARYGYDFDKALQERKAITTRNQEIQKSLQGQETTAVNKEMQVKTALDNEAKRLGIVPIGENSNFHPELYQKFEEKVLKKILSKKDDGEGKTQEQAVKEVSKDLYNQFRQYQDLKNLSTWAPSEFNRKVNLLQKDFANNDTQPIMFDTLISDYNVSPMYAAHKTYPIKPGSIPTLKKTGQKVAGVLPPTMDNFILSQLKKEMGKTNSPLSIAYELEKQGQNPRRFIDYLKENNKDLEVWQNDHLNKNINMFDLKDMWLQAWE